MARGWTEGHEDAVLELLETSKYLGGKKIDQNPGVFDFYHDNLEIGLIC